ncbi:unnamed protein product, partial [Allacma fusca]
NKGNTKKVSPSEGNTAGSALATKKTQPQSHKTESSPRDSMELIDETVERYLSDESDSGNARKLSKKQRHSTKSGGIHYGHNFFIKGQSFDEDADDEHHHHRHSKCSIQKRKKGFNPCFPETVIPRSLDSWCTCIGVWHVIFSIIRLSLSILWEPVLTPAFLESVEYDPILVTAVILIGLSGIILVFSVFLRNQALVIGHLVLISLAFILLLTWSILLLQMTPLSHTELLITIESCHIVYCVFMIYLAICSLGWLTQLRADEANKTSDCLS